MKTILTLLLAMSLSALADDPSYPLKGDNFQLIAPVQMTVGTPVPAKAPQVDTVMYQGVVGPGMTLALTYTDYQPGTVAKTGPANLVATIGQSLLKMGKNVNNNHFALNTKFGQAGANYDSTLSSNTGLIADYSYNIYAVGDRIYILSCITQYNQPGSNGDSATFFNSFQVSGPGAASPTVAAAPPSPAPVVNQSFTLKGDKFQITAPVQLTGGTPPRIQAPQIDAFTYQGTLDNAMTFSVTYIDYQPGAVAKAGPTDILYDIGNSNALKIAKDAKLQGSYPLTDHIGQAGSEYVSHGTASDGKPIYCFQYLHAVDDRIYELMIIGEPDLKGYDADGVNSFFSSFKLTGVQ
jgi:hypothetical protein